MIKIGHIEHFDLAKIAGSGQVFRWRDAERGRWFVPVAGKDLIASQDAEGVSLICEEEDVPFWRTYLAIDEDYDAIIAELSGQSEAQDKALAFADGIRTIRAPFFETAITAICTQNNSIPNITAGVERICGGWHDPFPTAEQIIERLGQKSAHLGYREPYIIGFCEDYLEGRFAEIEKLDAFHTGGTRPSYDEISRELCAIKGIGPKVAACICLFSLGYDEAVPRDVWIKRLEETYDVKWHPQLAGIQQQFLFYAIREGAI